MDILYPIKFPGPKDYIQSNDYLEKEHVGAGAAEME